MLKLSNFGRSRSLRNMSYKKKRRPDNLPAGQRASQRELEQRIEELLRRARKADEDAGWHEERARVWEQIDAHQRSLGDLCSACEPLAEFNAETHRNQMEKKQKRTQRLLEEATCLRQEIKRLAQ